VAGRAAEQAGQALVGAHLDDDGAPPAGGGGDGERGAHGGAPDAALAGHEQQIALEDRRHGRRG
jgi:hypothetical protein